MQLCRSYLLTGNHCHIAYPCAANLTEYACSANPSQQSLHLGVSTCKAHVDPWVTHQTAISEHTRMPLNSPEEVGIPLLIFLDLLGVLTKHTAVQLLCLGLHRQPHKAA